MMLSAFVGCSIFAPVFLTSKPLNFVVYNMLPQQISTEYQWLNWLLASALFGLFLLVSYVLITSVMFILAIVSYSSHKISLFWVGFGFFCIFLIIGAFSDKHVKQALSDVAAKRPIVIQHVGDGSTTGRIVAEQLNSYYWGDNIRMQTTSVTTMDEWRKAVNATNEGADLAMFSLYHTLYKYTPGIVPEDEQQVMSPLEVQEWTQKNLKLPSIGGWGFFVEHGGMLAIAVSAYEQGEQAAQLVTQIVDKGIPPHRLPVRKSAEFLVHMRGSLLEKHNVKMPVIYQAFARATNNYHE
jgi:hypothetical protein